MNKVKGLDNEVVVDAVTATVVVGVIELELAERHIANSGSKCVVGGGERLKALVEHLGFGVEQLSYVRGDGVHFHANHRGGVWGVGDEVTGAGAWFQHRAGGVACGMKGLPHGCDDLVAGEKRGERCFLQVLIDLGGDKIGKLVAQVGPFGASAVENVGHRTPAGVSGENALFFRCCPPLLLVEGG